MKEMMERELDWDDQIENDGAEFVILPEGDYDFEVRSVERGRHNGSDKLPPCNKATLSIRLMAEDGEETTIRHNLFLHSKCEGLLCAFFTAIGQRKHGEKISMNWNAVPGSRGRCKVKIRKWTSTNGNEMQSNEIARFYEPEEGQKTAPQWKAGDF